MPSDRKDDNDNLERLLDFVEGAIDVARNNRDMLEPLVDDSGTRRLRIDEGEGLKEVYKQDDAVIISVEIKEGGLEKLEVGQHKDGVYIVASGTKYVADVPPDVDVAAADAEFSNGVLTVTMPREEEPEVIEDLDGSIEDEDDDESNGDNAEDLWG